VCMVVSMGTLILIYEEVHSQPKATNLKFQLIVFLSILFAV